MHSQVDGKPARYPLGMPPDHRSAVERVGRVGLGPADWPWPPVDTELRHQPRPHMWRLQLQPPLLDPEVADGHSRRSRGRFETRYDVAQGRDALERSPRQ